MASAITTNNTITNIYTLPTKTQITVGHWRPASGAAYSVVADCYMAIGI